MVQGGFVFQPPAVERSIFSIGLIGIELVERSTTRVKLVA
jgi:hypothetical protein